MIWTVSEVGLAGASQGTFAPGLGRGQGPWPTNTTPAPRCKYSRNHPALLQLTSMGAELVRLEHLKKYMVMYLGGSKEALLGHLLMIKPCQFENNRGCLLQSCIASTATYFGCLAVTESVKRGSLLELSLLKMRPVRACHRFILTQNILASSCHFKYCGENKAFICLL